MARTHRLLIQDLPGIPEVAAGDDLARLIVEALGRAGWSLEAGDLLAVAHKVVSKAEGRLVTLSEVTPGERALELGRELNKDPRKVEVILGESRRVLRARRHPGQEQGTMICEHRLGFISANAGVDESNLPGEGCVLLLPEDPDRSARQLQRRIERSTGVRTGIIIMDTFGRPWRRGLVNVAIGLAGVPALVELAGTRDASGKTLRVSAPALADEVAAAAGLVMPKDGARPVALLRGLCWEEVAQSAMDLLRPEEEDLFR